MGTFYGRKGYKIDSSWVNSIATTGGTVLSSGDDSNGAFAVSFRHDLGGCGNPDSGIFVQLKDNIIWTGMSVEFQLLGSASCWSFNNLGYGQAVGSGTGNMLPYSEAAGDLCVKTYLAQNDAPYTTHDKVNACDNNADNFFRFNTSVYRNCTFVRRRDVNGSLAGPHHGRSCNSTGSGAITIIKNIYVW